MHTYELIVDGSATYIKSWVAQHPCATMERLDPHTINVYCDDNETVDELIEFCDSYDIQCRLI